MYGSWEKSGEAREKLWPLVGDGNTYRMTYRGGLKRYGKGLVISYKFCDIPCTEREEQRN